MNSPTKNLGMLLLLMLLGSLLNSNLASAHIGIQPLSKIAIHKTILSLSDSAAIKASPLVLGLKVISVTFPKFGYSPTIRFSLRLIPRLHGIRTVLPSAIVANFREAV